MNEVRFRFDPQRALPNAAYRDEGLLAAEMTRIWHADWVFVATEDALAARGDQLPVVVGRQPVLLVRNQAGELAAFSNLCAHRGTLLVERPTNASRIQCPYHGWTYTDAGELHAAPFAPSEFIDKGAHCLPRYRVESWHGLVFVSLDPDVEPLAERFAVVEPHLASRGLDRLRHRADQQGAKEWACNWKLAIINAMESYHLFKVHRTTLEPYAPTRGAYYIAGSARATVTGGEVTGGEDYLLVSLPPGFVGVLSGDSFDWLCVHPVDVARCAVRTGSAVARSPSTIGRLARSIAESVSAAAYPMPDFLPEDKEICERVQRGVTGDFVPGRLVPMERVVADFGRYLNWRLNDVEPPAVYTETTREPRSGANRTTEAVPSTGFGQTGIGHPHIDARSLDMARIVVERVDADRSLFSVGHENLERERQLRGKLSRASAEWEQILERPWTDIRAVLLEESDEGQRLRSSHPFRGIVTEEERLAIIERHPPPGPHEPYDASTVPQEVMEELLSVGKRDPIQQTGSRRRRHDPP